MEQLGIFGNIPADLASVSAGGRQFSPCIPGSERLEDCAAASLGRMVMAAPAGTIERRYTLALALKALAPGAELTVMAPKDKGGSRLLKELRDFGCEVEEVSKRHHRICSLSRPGQLDGISEAIAAGSIQQVKDLGLWSQPGIFSWNRVDPGSELLLPHITHFSGEGADFGCGYGMLALAVMTSPKVQRLLMADIDQRAIAAARLNVADARAQLLWTDLRHPAHMPQKLDFVVMNPPFHAAGAQDHSLGQDFIQTAAACLRKGGTLWLTANRHLPYETVLGKSFRKVSVVAQASGFKIITGQK